MRKVSFCISAVAALFAQGVLPISSASADQLGECIDSYRQRYGVSADEAIRQCRDHGAIDDSRSFACVKGEYTGRYSVTSGSIYYYSLMNSSGNTIVNQVSERECRSARADFS